jgi:hypothetical protein
MSCCLYCIFFRFDLNPATVVLDGRWPVLSMQYIAGTLH